MNIYMVFVSLPMNGLDRKTIEENFESAQEEFRRRYTLTDKQVIFTSNLFCDAPSLACEYDGVWYLGHALNAMSQCDAVFFYGNWQEARGCRIEHEVCEQYGIPYVEV